MGCSIQKPKNQLVKDGNSSSQLKRNQETGISPFASEEISEQQNNINILKKIIKTSELNPVQLKKIKGKYQTSPRY